MGIQSGCADIGAFIAIATTLYLTEMKGWAFPFFLDSYPHLLQVKISSFGNISDLHFGQNIIIKTSL